MPKQLTKEQQEDVKVRTEKFRKEYTALVEKNQVDFYSYPTYIPAQTGGFETVANMVIFDKKYIGTKEDERVISE